MISSPEELRPYIDYDNGEIIAVDLPDELKDEFEKFKAYLKKLEEEYPLSDF